MALNEALIVGAGPTGLTLAAEFQRFGIPFRLIDKSNHGAKYSQALVVQARTLEQLERYGLAEEAVKQGRQLKQATLISEGKTIVSIPFDKIRAAILSFFSCPKTRPRSCYSIICNRSGYRLSVVSS